MKERVEEQIAQRLPGYLLDRSVEYHARRGLRLWCDCEWCEEKKWSTVTISHTPPSYIREVSAEYDKLIRSTLPSHFDGCGTSRYDLKMDHLTTKVKERRRSLASDLRYRLSKLMEKVI